QPMPLLAQSVTEGRAFAVMNGSELLLLQIHQTQVFHLSFLFGLPILMVVWRWPKSTLPEAGADSAPWSRSPACRSGTGKASTPVGFRRAAGVPTKRRVPVPAPSGGGRADC